MNKTMSAAPFGFPGYLVREDGFVIGKTGIILKTGKNKKGYLHTALLENKKRKTLRIHRLVATLFIPNPENKPCVRHLDGNKENNHASNLAWGTYKENEHDKKSHGTWNARFSGKLSGDAREEIIRLFENGVSQVKIAEMFNVSRPTVTRLLNGSTWSKLCVS